MLFSLVWILIFPQFIILTADIGGQAVGAAP